MWEGGWWQGWREEEVGAVSVPAVREAGSRLRGAHKYGSLPEALRRAGAASSLVLLFPPLPPSLWSLLVLQLARATVSSLDAAVATSTLCACLHPLPCATCRHALLLLLRDCLCSSL